MLRLTVSETAFGIVRRFIGLTGGVGAVCARTAVDEKFTVRDLVVIRGFLSIYRLSHQASSGGSLLIAKPSSRRNL